jgi:hypothetical protein
MSLQELFAEIEGVEFSAKLGVLSGFSSVKTVLHNDHTLKALMEALATSDENRRVVFQHVLKLLPENPHPDYAHPYDHALTGYLYVLSQTDSALTAQAIEHVLQTPKLFWARRLAQELRETAQSTTAK